MSAAQNFTELQPIIDVVKAHNGVVMNGHDHCLGHFQYNGTNFILSGGAGLAQAGDCNNGVALGPYAKYLGANSQAGEIILLFSYQTTAYLTSRGANRNYSGKWFRDYGYKQRLGQRRILYARHDV
jgi:hypothetical protein